MQIRVVYEETQPGADPTLCGDKVPVQLIVFEV